ncbi:putative nucleotidyltransferase [Thiorhodovibrio frisius]|uniref:Putative nucleotidyltransferase n=1 Tax=Thiorhodovibrio frisius TaxID=631362 RepID=H8Z6I0_9GAMM|nr:putative nucleotidyltransferase [Thiorhodovibrio frisius]WPL20354.1 Nucleotidyltransferase domain protein [Thiorhodovibrio frisius]
MLGLLQHISIQSPFLKREIGLLILLQGANVNRDQTLKILTEHKKDLSRLFGVSELALFGSTVRGDERVDSDIDILVSFDGSSTSQRYFGVQFYLEDLLGRPVDLVTRKALRRELAPYVEREAIHV